MASTDANTSFHGIAARLDRIPISGFHKKVMWLLAGITFCDSVDMGVGGPIGMVLQDQGFMTLEQFALFNSITMIGYLVGGLMAGALSDGIGRKKSVVICGSIFTVFCFIAAMSPDANFLTGCRFFMGLGLGAAFPAGYSALTEFTPPEKRGKYQSYVGLIANCGTLFASVMNLIILPISRLARSVRLLRHPGCRRRGALRLLLAGVSALAGPDGPRQGSGQDRYRPREQDRCQGRDHPRRSRFGDRAP